MAADDEGRGRVPLRVLLGVALVGSLLAVLIGRSDLLTGRAPPVGQTEAPCVAPEIAADPTPLMPDAALDVVFGLLPMLPLPDLGTVVPLDFNQYESAAQYARFASSSLLAGSTRSAMANNGFVRANTIGYEAGKTFFGAEALQTASPAQAARLEEGLLASACRAGVALALRPLADIPGGVAFVYHDWDLPPFRAMFLEGDTVVRLNVCICVEDRGDPYAALDDWARDVDGLIRERVA